MKPGVEAARTGVFPHWPASAVNVSSTAGFDSAPATISTRGMTGAGLKKCMPATRPGRSRPAAMAVTESDEVLVAMMASGPTNASIRRNRSILASRSSTMASITRAASAIPSIAVS